jgi:hypothetical protein
MDIPDGTNKKIDFISTFKYFKMRKSDQREEIYKRTFKFKTRKF